MEMEKELEQFRQEAQRLRAGRQGGSLPFPETLRAFAVRYAQHTLEAGGFACRALWRLSFRAAPLSRCRPAGRPARWCCASRRASPRPPLRRDGAF